MLSILLVLHYTFNGLSLCSFVTTAPSFPRLIALLVLHLKLLGNVGGNFALLIKLMF